MLGLGDSCLATMLCQSSLIGYIRHFTSTLIMMLYLCMSQEFSKFCIKESHVHVNVSRFNLLIHTAKFYSPVSSFQLANSEPFSTPNYHVGR